MRTLLHSEEISGEELIAVEKDKIKVFESVDRPDEGFFARSIERATRDGRLNELKLRDKHA